MKALSKQGQHLWSNRFAVVSSRHTLKNMRARNFPGNGGWLRSEFAGGPSLQKKSASLTKYFSIAKKRELESANNATIERLQESLTETGAILPVQQAAFVESALCVQTALLGEDGFASILPLEHPLVMTYVSSCQQDHHMIYVSPQIAWLGFTPETWLGKTDFHLQQVHEDDSGRVGQALQHSRCTGQKFNCHYRLYDSSGKVRWVHDEASVVCDESGAPLFFRGVMLDVTDKKEMEAELNEHRYYLERNVEQRTEHLMKRIAVLESCNAALCDRLALIRRESGVPKQASAARIIRLGAVTQPMPVTQTTSVTQTYDCVDQLNGISDWARNMIRWRLAAAGVIA